MSLSNKKGCGKEFVWIPYLNDKRICGQIEDLKHIDHILLCPKCKESNCPQKHNPILDGVGEKAQKLEGDTKEEWLTQQLKEAKMKDKQEAKNESK